MFMYKMIPQVIFLAAVNAGYLELSFSHPVTFSYKLPSALFVLNYFIRCLLLSFSRLASMYLVPFSRLPGAIA